MMTRPWHHRFHWLSLLLVVACCADPPPGAPAVVPEPAEVADLAAPAPASPVVADPVAPAPAAPAVDWPLWPLQPVPAERVLRLPGQAEVPPMALAPDGAYLLYAPAEPAGTLMRWVFFRRAAGCGDPAGTRHATAGTGV